MSRRSRTALLDMMDSMVTVQRIAQLVRNPQGPTLIDNLRARIQHVLTQETHRPKFSE